MAYNRAMLLLFFFSAASAQDAVKLEITRAGQAKVVNLHGVGELGWIHQTFPGR